MKQPGTDETRSEKRAMVDADLASFENSVGSVEADGTLTDPYRAEAAKVFGVAYADVTDEQRKLTKLRLWNLAYTPYWWR